MSTEAQKRASNKYRLKHKNYYNKKANEYQTKVRKERREYKQRIDDVIEYIKEHQRKDKFLNLNEWQARDLLNILEGK